MNNIPENYRRIFKDKSLLRGELWLGDSVFDELGLQNSIESHVHLVKHYKLDILCIPLSDKDKPNRAYSYRYFKMEDLKQINFSDDFYVFVVIDGPWQRLVMEQGLKKLLTSWYQADKRINDILNMELEHVINLIKECMHHPVQAIVITEDIAGAQGTFISPSDIERLLMPCWMGIASTINQSGVGSLFHSCGRIENILPIVFDSGFNGLAAIELKLNNLNSFAKKAEGDWTFMGGVESETEGNSSVLRENINILLKQINHQALLKYFIYCSSHGIGSLDELKALDSLYRQMGKLMGNR